MRPSADDIARVRAGFPPGIPRAFGDVLADAIALEEHEGTPRAVALRRHYFEVMPAMRRDQLRHPLLHVPLDWDRLPRLAGALDRLSAILVSAGAEPIPRAPTIAALYARSYYGAFMPMIYGYPADLAYFSSRVAELGEAEVIDRYLAPPILHELAHLSADRAGGVPLYLDECVAGYLSLCALPEFAFPPPDEDVGLYCAPWFAQVGEALVRALGLHAVVRAHAGLDAWPEPLAREALALGRDDYRRNRQPHLLGDGFHPQPWLALFERFGPSEEQPIDRQIVEHALRAMCTHSYLVGATYRVVSRPPPGPIRIDLATRSVTTDPGPCDPAPPFYPFPAAIARRLQNIRGYTVLLRDLGGLSEVANVLCSGGMAREAAAYRLERENF